MLSAWLFWPCTPLGLFSRVTAVLSWVIVVSTARRVPIALFGFDQVLSALDVLSRGDRGERSGGLARPILATLAPGSTTRRRRVRPCAAPASGAGRRVSPDEPAEPPATVSANLALRLIQLHLVVIYGMAGLSKLQGPSWWTGTALWRTMATGEFVGLEPHAARRLGRGPSTS